MIYLVAGFPASRFDAGFLKKQFGRETGFADKTQGTLFFDVCRILKEKRPKAFMLENVKNLCSHDKGKTFQVIKESLDELNYEVFYDILDGQNYVHSIGKESLLLDLTEKGMGKILISNLI